MADYLGCSPFHIQTAF